MGYTHYWSHDENLGRKALFAAMQDARKIVEAAQAKGIALAGPNGDGEPMVSEGIALNGVAEESHESFIFPNNPNDPFINKVNGSLWAFCKTARKPYDLVVCAILLVLKHHMGKQIRISSDGDRREDEWLPAEQMVKEVLGYTVRYKREETLHREPSVRK